MQDYNYWANGCMEVTVELSCCKYPPPAALPQIWLNNKNSLIDYLKMANKGIRGIIRYSNNRPARGITVKIDSREPYFVTNINGEYYRILLDGDYILSLMLDCNQVYSTDIHINGLLELNITLPVDVYMQSLKIKNRSKTVLSCD